MTTVLCRCTVPHYRDATTSCAGPATTVDDVRAASLARLEAALDDPMDHDYDVDERRLPEPVTVYFVERPDLDLAIAILRVLVRGVTPAEAIADLRTARQTQAGPEPTVPEVREAQLDVERIKRLAAGNEPETDLGPPLTQEQAEKVVEILGRPRCPDGCVWCNQEHEPIPDRDADPVLAALPEDTPAALRDAFARRDLGAVIQHVTDAHTITPEGPTT